MGRPSILKDKNPNWQGGKFIECPICGIKKWKKPYQIKKKRLYCSKQCGLKGRNVHPKKGSEHPSWKGNNASYFVIHKWIRKNYGKAEKCKKCGSIHNVVWANISHKYKRNIKDFIQLCQKCHMKYDVKTGWGIATKRYNLS